MESQVIIYALSTTMQIVPQETFIEFIKMLEYLHEWSLHDEISKNDIKIFNTPKGTMSSEYGVYIVDLVSDRNINQEKGWFKSYDG